MADSLGDRMKAYEAASSRTLTRRVPVLLRLDGRAFHTFTRRYSRPWDGAFHARMWRAAQALCEDAMGAQVAYVQSDEITVLLTDDATVTTEAWFGNDAAKLCSVAASVVTAAFNIGDPDAGTFDCRVFTVPREDVVNAFLWRQQDAERNSLSMLCQSAYSHQQLMGVKREEQHEMLHAKGLNWNDCPTAQKRGVCVVRGPERGWVVDTEIPVFSQDRAYIGRYVDVDRG